MDRQKNIKKLCPVCRKSYKPSKKIVDSILASTGKTINDIYRLETEALRDGIGKDINNMSSDIEGIHRLYRARLGGCVDCSHTGYNGNINIVELVDYERDNLELLITKNNLSPKIINSYLSDTGFINMKTDHLIKSLRGVIEYS